MDRWLDGWLDGTSVYTVLLLYGMPFHSLYTSSFFLSLFLHPSPSNGRRLRGAWGTVSQNLRGDGPSIRPRNILSQLQWMTKKGHQKCFDITSNFFPYKGPPNLVPSLRPCSLIRKTFF